MSSRVHTLIYCTLHVLVFANPVLHEKRDLALSDSLNRRRIEGSTILPLRIGLMENQFARRNAEKWLMDISDPDSPNFGRHWTQDKVINTFKPTEETIGNVSDWLHGHGIFEYTHSDNKLWFAFDLSARKAESMLQTEYFEHESEDGGLVASCDYYHLPDHLQSHIHYITPGVKGSDITARSSRTCHFGPPGNAKRSDVPRRRSAGDIWPPPAHDLTDCSAAVTPACIRKLYNFSVPDPSLPVSPNNTLGIFADNDLYLQSDLDLLYKHYAPNIPSGTSPIYAGIDHALALPNSTHGLNSNLVFGELELDLETSIPIIYPQNVTLFELRAGHRCTNPISWDNFFNRFLDAIDGSYCSAAQRGNSSAGGKPQCGVYKPTYVMSYSYAVPEHFVTPYWQERQCNEYLKLGLQGTTIFFASADWGVGGLGQWVNQRPPWKDDDVCNRHPKHGPRVFMPAFPASCPWVTSVGATELPRGHDDVAHVQEIGAQWPLPFPNGTVDWVHKSSGGGFSLHFEAPSYQKEALSYFFENHNPRWPYFVDGKFRNSTGRYNRNGRGIPDISAVGSDQLVYVYDFAAPYYGTSVATPLWAALLNRIVEERLRVGKGPLGFINPTLYKHSEALHDITKGENGYCERDQGFEAVPGWDPMTGLGTPDYSQLLDLFMNLP